LNDIAFIAIKRSYGEYVKNDLMKYFNNYAKINSYTVEEINDVETLHEKCILISSFDIFQKVKNKASGNSEIIVNKLTIKKENLKKIVGIPKNSKVLIANISFRQCMEVISLLYACGYKDYEYIPYYNVYEVFDPDIKYAITPGETDMVPKSITNIIDIGERVCSVSSILEIAHTLKLRNFSQDISVKKLLRNIEATDFSIETILGEKEDLKVQISVLLEMMGHGIIITDVSGIIMSCNSSALNLLKDRTNHLEGFNVSAILPELDNIKSIRHITRKEEKIININGKNIIISFIPFINDNRASGFVVTLYNFEELEDRQNDIRTKISSGNHKAKYTFEDIKGQSSAVQKAIKTAKMMANSSSSIMIFGESGTGKEVFAQSIHNESPRKNQNFVAVNCAAIPENLLESEMFGYEEGAFTGAKKGGKIGYFELAHNGTLFLDEIAEMPLLMQSKLLRAIEEMKIIKVGSNKIVSVDVRIIAATNKNLRKLVEQGKFREDLYYRLNVLPLIIPNLNDRKEDIMIIARYFIKNTNKDIHFSRDAEKMMNTYNWQGNIRELRNVVEYIISLDKTVIEKDDLPISTHQENINPSTEKNNNNLNNDLILKFILREGIRIDLYKVILEELENSYNKKERIGRIKLMNIFENYGLFYSEQEIRICLIKLDDYGFINSRKGRAGSVITTSGIQLKNKIVELLECC
jgi:transcriptional regulator with PAS, ATPase and Fis domain